MIHHANKTGPDETCEFDDDNHHESHHTSVHHTWPLAGLTVMRSIDLMHSFYELNRVECVVCDWIVCVCVYVCMCFIYYHQHITLPRNLQPRSVFALEKFDESNGSRQ